MALARARQAARRVKDRWKAKKWYKVTAPASFQQKLIGETMADDPSKLLGRRVETTLHELTGDMKLMHVKIYFQVTDVVDNQAKTSYAGHTMTSDYVRRLTRRGHTKIPAVFDVKTKDGSRLRVKPFAVADRRCQTTQAKTIRRIMQEQITKSAEEHTLSGFLKAVLMGDLTTQTYKECRKIHPLRRIEIAKTDMLQAPAVEVDETPVFDEPEPEPTAEERAAAEEVEGDEEGEAVEGIEADSEDEGAEAESDDGSEEE